MLGEARCAASAGLDPDALHDLKRPSVGLTHWTTASSWSRRKAMGRENGVVAQLAEWTRLGQGRPAPYPGTRRGGEQMVAINPTGV